MCSIFKIFSAALLALLVVVPANALAAEGWEEDLDTALAKAKESEMLVLADFTGSDWCGWCIKLHDEVFVKEAFKGFAGENLVLCAIDFPKDKSLVSEEQAKKNKAYQGKYAVRGFPTIFLLEPDGSVVLKTGYRPGGAEPYVDFLRGVKDAHVKVKNFLAESKGKPDAAEARKIVDGIPEEAAVLRARVVLAAYPKEDAESRAEAAFNLIQAKQDTDGRFFKGLTQAATERKSAAARAAAGFYLLLLGHDGDGKHLKDLQAVADGDGDPAVKAKAAFRIVSLRKDENDKYLDYLRDLGDKDKEGYYKQIRSEQVGQEIMNLLSKVAGAVQQPPDESDQKAVKALETDAAKLIELINEAAELIEDPVLVQRFIVFQALAYRALDDQKGGDEAWARATKMDPNADILKQAKTMINPSDS